MGELVTRLAYWPLPQNAIFRRLTLGLDMAGNQFSWMKQAACKGVPSYIFFPDERKLPDFKEDFAYLGRDAKSFCTQCPVLWRCKQFATLHNEHGIWGGSSEGEREKISSQEDRRVLRDVKSRSGTYSPLYPIPGHNDDT